MDPLQAIGLFFEPGDIFEIRALGVGRTAIRNGAIHSGYFNFENERAIKSAIASLDGRAEGIYVVLNRCDPSLLSRAANRLQARPKCTTADADITEWRWLYIDLDPVRPAGISANDEEHGASLGRAQRIRDYLGSRRWPEPVYADSGNGAHLLYRLPPMDIATAYQLAKLSLKALSDRFSDGVVKVDEATATAARLCKLYGTMARKGDSTRDRPHRRSRIIDEPEKLEIVTIEALEALVADTSQKPSHRKSISVWQSPSQLDTDEWLERNALEVIRGPEEYRGGLRRILSKCPFNPAHRGPAIIEMPNGALIYKCLHNSCISNDWHAFRQKVEADCRDEHHKSGKVSVPKGTHSWDPPVAFQQFALPDFPTEALPTWFREFVEAEATATQTPADLSAMLGLSVLAVACAKKVVVQVKPGYSEPVNIYTVTALPPGNRKTAVFAAVMKPLEDYERCEAARLKAEIAQQQSAYKIKESRLKRLQEQAVQAKPSERHTFEQEACALAAELSATAVGIAPKYVVDDCTPETLPGLLRDQGGRIAAMSAEGDLFDLMAGRYSGNHMPNFGVFLKGHAGDAIRVDRVGRPPEFVTEPAVTIGLAVQPDVIQGLAANPRFRARGLLGRFLYAMPISKLGSRDTNAPPVPEKVFTDYREHMTALLHIPLRSSGEASCEPHGLTITPDGTQRLQQFERWVEPQLADFGELGSMTDWGGKLVGAVVRVAGLLHMADHAGAEDSWQSPIARTCVERAIHIAQFLIPHAKAAYAEMGADEIASKAKLILRWIEKKALTTFTGRELHQSLRSRFKRAEDLDQPLEVLASHGYIRRRPQESSDKAPGRPPSPTYDVNPIWTLQNTQNTHNLSDFEDFEYFESEPGSEVPSDQDG